MIVFKVRKREMWHIITFRACLNFMNCTGGFCHYFIHTESIFTIGVKSVLFMEHPRTVCGAVDAWRREKQIRKECLHLRRSMEFLRA